MSCCFNIKTLLMEAANSFIFSGLVTKRGGKGLVTKKKELFLSSKANSLKKCGYYGGGGKALVAGPLKKDFLRLP